MASVTDPLADKNAVLSAHAENRAVSTLTAQLPEAIVDAKFDRSELALTIARERIVDACRALQAGGYNFLEDITCVDWYPNRPRFQIAYQLLSMERKEYVRLHVMVDEADASVDSITAVWPAANFYEREIFDLFGVRFGGHPNLRRILMPEDFQGNPMRKDFPVEGYR